MPKATSLSNSHHVSAKVKLASALGVSCRHACFRLLSEKHWSVRGHFWAISGACFCHTLDRYSGVVPHIYMYICQSQALNLALWRAFSSWRQWVSCMFNLIWLHSNVAHGWGTLSIWSGPAFEQSRKMVQVTGQLHVWGTMLTSVDFVGIIYGKVKENNHVLCFLLSSWCSITQSIQ